ncbi:MAG: methylmalonyl-CoA epimerase [Tunicatimonas sp.]
MPYFAQYQLSQDVILRIEHLGIAVADPLASQGVFDRLLGRSAYKTEEVSSENVQTTFYAVGDIKLELVSDTPEGEIVRKFIAKRGEGLHHIALAVDDIRAEIKRLKNEGFTFINDTPKAGADNKLICFLHPKSTNGVLVELCQERNS